MFKNLLSLGGREHEGSASEGSTQLRSKGNKQISDWDSQVSYKMPKYFPFHLWPGHHSQSLQCLCICSSITTFIIEIVILWHAISCMIFLAFAIILKSHHHHHCFSLTFHVKGGVFTITILTIIIIITAMAKVESLSSLSSPSSSSSLPWQRWRRAAWLLLGTRHSSGCTAAAWKLLKYEFNSS